MVGTALAAAGIAGTPEAALADYNACPTGSICFFDGHGGAGAMIPVAPIEEPVMPAGWNDRASSLWNRSDASVCVWTDAGWYGYHYNIPPGQQQELLFAYDKGVSSYEINGCGG